jgi:AraC-like DNA-binding protein
MFFVPVSFIATLLLLGFGWRLWRGREPGDPAASLFVWLVAVNALQSVLLGLRWGYGWQAVQPFMVLLASVIPPLSWLAFRGLGARGQAWSHADALHALPAVAVTTQWCLALLGLRGWGMDFTIILTFAGYGLALLRMARSGPDGLVASRLDGVLMSYRSLQLTGWALIGSAVSDVLISMDFAWGVGQHAPAVVSGFMTLIVLVLGLAALLAEGNVLDRAATDQGDAAPVVPLPDVLEPDAAVLNVPAVTEQDQETSALLRALMVERQLFKDVDLNLIKLARRLGLPSRTVSQAVNRVHGMSVSQYVNNYRIAEACRLLAETEAPVTGIVFEAGFMTKSNFNREFLRVKGQSPTQWRKENASRVVHCT